MIGAAPNASQRPAGRRLYVVAAWASPAVALVLALAFWLWSMNHQGQRGDRSTAALLFYLFVFAASTAGGLAGAVSLFGIRSWRHALLILPGAALGVCANGYLAVIGLLSYALEGRNLGG
jgi:hypothetical protein